MGENELRIGNWIYDILDRHNCKVTLDDFQFMNNYRHSNNHPIPYKSIELTEEWLLKLGFEKSEVVYKKKWIELWWSSYCNCYQLRLYKIGNDFDYKINIYFVHQLQNLYFILTGEEL
jgi:hypothetical protein